MIKKMFDIEGMHCGACSTGIEMFLSNTEGVTSAKVDYDTKKATVTVWWKDKQIELVSYFTNWQ